MHVLNNLNCRQIIIGRPIFTQNVLHFALGNSEFRVTRNFQKMSKICHHRLFSIKSDPADIFESACVKMFPVYHSIVFLCYFVYIRCILKKNSRLKLRSTRRDSGLFTPLKSRHLVSYVAIRSRV